MRDQHEGLFDRIRHAFRALIRLAAPLPGRAGRGGAGGAARGRAERRRGGDAPGGREGVVEYAVYGAAGRAAGRRATFEALRGRRARRGRRPRRCRTTGTSAGSASTSRCWSAGASTCARPGSEPAQRGGVEEVVIDPGGAFGTGTHPTTRMCLELLLEAAPAPRLTSQGVGGTSFWRPRLRLRACSRSRPRSSGSSRCWARRRSRGDRGGDRNARANASSRAAASRPAREPAPVADVVAANLTRGLLLQVAEGWARRRRCGRASLIASGSAPREADGVAAALERCGLSERRRLVSGDWVARYWPTSVTTFAVKFLGCKVSQADAMLARSRLLAAGHEEAPEDDAELHVINTCCITREAEAKSRQSARRSARDGRRVVVDGLRREPERRAVRRDRRVGDGAGRHGGRRRRGGRRRGRARRCIDTDDRRRSAAAASPRTRTRGFVKVQDGCDCHCSYCIIPKVRGARPLAAGERGPATRRAAASSRASPRWS